MGKKRGVEMCERVVVEIEKMDMSIGLMMAQTTITAQLIKFLENQIFAQDTFLKII